MPLLETVQRGARVARTALNRLSLNLFDNDYVVAGRILKGSAHPWEIGAFQDHQIKNLRWAIMVGVFRDKTFVHPSSATQAVVDAKERLEAPPGETLTNEIIARAASYRKSRQQ